MPSMSPRVLLRSTAAVMIGFALLCPSSWGEAPSSSPKVLTSLWQKHVAAQLTGLDLSWAGHTVAITVAPSASGGDHRLLVYDLLGRELWTTSRKVKILGVSLVYPSPMTDSTRLSAQWIFRLHFSPRMGRSRGSGRAEDSHTLRRAERVW